MQAHTDCTNSKISPTLTSFVLPWLTCHFGLCFMRSQKTARPAVAAVYGLKIGYSPVQTGQCAWYIKWHQAKHWFGEDVLPSGEGRGSRRCTRTSWTRYSRGPGWGAPTGTAWLGVRAEPRRPWWRSRPVPRWSTASTSVQSRCLAARACLNQRLRNSRWRWTHLAGGSNLRQSPSCRSQESRSTLGSLSTTAFHITLSPRQKRAFFIADSNFCVLSMPSARGNNIHYRCS